MSVARTYAKALYEAACEKQGQAAVSKTCDEFEKQLDSLLASLKSSREMEIALVAPITTPREKAALVDAISKKMGLSDLLSRFLNILATKDRLGILKEIRDQLAEVRLEAEGGVSGAVVSAEAMSSQDIEELAKAFGKKLGKRVEFRVSTDPALLAGVKVTINGVTYDGSLRSQLEQLRDRFVAAHAAASGA